MMAGPLKDAKDAVAHPEGVSDAVVTAAALYGANASGKTNVLRALQFMAQAVEFSQVSWRPDQQIDREPFAGGPAKEMPSEFAVDLIVKSTRYQYGFSVSDTAIVEEWLHAYPKGKRQVWFKRHLDDEAMTFGENMPGENRVIEGLMRPNSLFLSTAAQNNHKGLLDIYRWFSRSLEFVMGPRQYWANRSAELCSKSQYKAAIVKMLSFADLGISDLQVNEEVMPEPLKRVFSAMTAALKSEFKEQPTPGFVDHRKVVQLLHRIGDQVVPLEEDQESDGTRAYLALLCPILRAIRTGGVLCVDELDGSLHPLLAVRLVQLFNDPSSNRLGAQLIFNTHDTNLIAGELLRRDQIWFTEKKQDGSSQVYPLSDFKPRKEENLAHGYLQGRYGAVPFLNPDLLPRDKEEVPEESANEES